MNTDALLDIGPDLLQDLGGEQGDGSGTIPDLGVLSTGDIDQGPRGGVNNVEQSKEGRTVVYRTMRRRGLARSATPGMAVTMRPTRDGSLSPVVDDQLVHPPRSERRSDGLGHGETCRDVAQELGSPLRRVGSLCQGSMWKDLEMSAVRVLYLVLWCSD